MSGRFRTIFDIDLTLTAPQDIVLNGMQNLNYATFRLPRGGGKDFLLASYALFCAASYPKCRILITAPTFRQVKINFREVQRLSLVDNFKELLLKKPFIASDVCYLKFKNGSSIDAMSLNDVAVKYAMDSDVVLVNEASSAGSEQLARLVFFGVENDNIKKIFFMSAGYYDYNYMNKIEAHDCFSTFAFGYKTFPEEFYDQSNIDEAKKELSADVFDMEYNAKVCPLLPR